METPYEYKDLGEDIEIPRPRWIGVLLSFFVPGFGLIRAGKLRRGIIWFLLCFLLPILGCFLIGHKSNMLFYFGAAVIIISTITQIVMWVDSFKPGKLNRYGWISFFVIVVIIFSLPNFALNLARVHKIPTNGMAPTLKGESGQKMTDYIITNRVAYKSREPERGDIISINMLKVDAYWRLTSSRKLKPDFEELIFVKRVIGLPNEKVTIKNGAIYINDTLMTTEDGIPDLGYILPDSNHMPTYISEENGGECILQDNQYLCLGDNTKNSLDGRYWGPVPKEAIDGKVARIFLPLDRSQTF